MDRFIHQQYSEEERERILRDSADFVEEGMKYTRTLTDNELTIEREYLAELSIKRSEIEDDKREVMKEFKMKLDPVNDEIKERLQKIKTRQEEITDDLFVFKDYDTGQAHFYDKRGEQVFSRRLRANEGQRTVMAALREAK